MRLFLPKMFSLRRGSNRSNLAIILFGEILDYRYIFSLSYNFHEQIKSILKFLCLIEGNPKKDKRSVNYYL